ncbi:MAG: 30S ribosomal protein S6, partial [Patescibacteria group bacterium]|nr:30S ribosomal protein S6 [Patescibacteria group bacterium]
LCHAGNRRGLGSPPPERASALLRGELSDQTLIWRKGCANLSLMTNEDMAEKAETQVYELGYHIISSIAEEKLPAEVTAIKDILEAEHAVFIAEEFPKLKHLTYTMTKVLAAKHLKFDTAYFGWMKFEIDPVAIPAIKKRLEGSQSILRFLLIKTVRESTLAVIKPPSFRGEPKAIPGLGAKVSAPVPSLMSEAEMDKTIEELVVE